MRLIFTAAVLGAALAAGTINAVAAPDGKDTYREEDDTVIVAYACTKDRHLVEGTFRMVPSHSDMERLNREIPLPLMQQSTEQTWHKIVGVLTREQMDAPAHAKLSHRIMSDHVGKLEREFESRSGGITLYVYQIETRFLYDADKVPSPGCG